MMHLLPGRQSDISSWKGATIEDAQKVAYNNVEKIKSDNLFYRHDIGNKALNK